MRWKRSERTGQASDNIGVVGLVTDQVSSVIYKRLVYLFTGNNNEIHQPLRTPTRNSRKKGARGTKSLK